MSSGVAKSQHSKARAEQREAHRPSEPGVLGWREWVAFPDLGINAIKAKVDTGARSSALHAYDCEEYSRRGVRWLRFKVHPRQRDSSREVECTAEIVDQRHVRSSSGRSELRWTVTTDVLIGTRRFAIELTLTRRDAMGFRMLLGRQAVRHHYVVDPGASYLAGGEPGRIGMTKKKKKKQLVRKKLSSASVGGDR